MTQWPRQRRPSEPEIIPPGAAPRPHGHIWIAEERDGYRRIGIMTPGPLQLLLLGMAVGAAALIAIVLLLGAVLLWLPVIGLVAAIAIVGGLLRTPARRLH